MSRTVYKNCRLLLEEGFVDNAVILVNHVQNEYQEPGEGEKPKKVKASIGDVILYAGPADAAPAQEQTDEIIDAEGKCVIPGLIDTNARMDRLNPKADDYVDNIGTAYRTFLSLRYCAEALQSGVTTVKAVGMPNNIDIALKNAFQKTMFFGPSVLATGPVFGIHGGKGHEIYGMIECSGADDFRAQVRIHLSRGLDGVTFQVSGDKMASLGGEFYPEMSPSELNAMVKHVHGAEKKVAVNASGAPSVRMAIDAGVDIIQQGYRIPDDCLQEMAEKGIWYIPCLVSTLGTELEAEHKDTVSRAVKAGVKIAAGTDILPSQPVDGTTAMIRELELLVECGMNPMQAIASATNMAAKCIGTKAGVLSAGRPADFLILEKNPEEDIQALRSILKVIHTGRDVDAWSVDGKDAPVSGGTTTDWTENALKGVKDPANYNVRWNLIKEM